MRLPFRNKYRGHVSNRWCDHFGTEYRILERAPRTLDRHIYFSRHSMAAAITAREGHINAKALPHG